MCRLGSAFRQRKIAAATQHLHGSLDPILVSLELARQRWILLVKLTNALIEFVARQGADEDVVPTVKLLPVRQYLVPRRISHDNVKSLVFTEEDFGELQLP